MIHHVRFFITVLCFTPFYADAASLGKYYKDDGDKPRYYVPAENEPVLGNQKTWHTTPYDLKLGALNMNCRKIDAVTEDYFEVTPSSVVGKSTYRFTPLAEEKQVENNLHARPVLSTEHVLFSQLPKVRDRNILIGCEVTRVFAEGRGFESTVEFASGALPFRVEVVRTEDVNRLPEVHSRQYGPHAKHAFDVYYPEGFKPGEDDPLPMVINIHGGGWGALDKMNDRIGEGATSWNESGIAFVSVNYRYVSDQGLLRLRARQRRRPADAVGVRRPAERLACDRRRQRDASSAVRRKAARAASTVGRRKLLLGRRQQNPRR